MQQQTIQNPADINKLSPKPVLPTVTKNYEFIEEKDTSTTAITVILYIVTAVVFFGAGYVTRMWQEAISTNPKTTNNTVSATSDENIDSWDTYTNDLLDISIKHPTEWTAKAIETKSEGACTAVYITISNGDYVFNINSACGAINQICEYDQSPKATDESILSFGTFTEIATSTTSYRRALNNKDQQQICLLKNGAYNSYIVPFGFITFDLPENYDEQVLAIMDKMLLTLTDTPTSNASATPKDEICIVDGAQYAVGESFDSTDGCNTCTCTSDGEIACTEMACTTP